jgi:hypothetical protein
LIYQIRRGYIVFAISFFFLFRGGVTGLPVFIPPYAYFCFFSAGFKIYIISSYLERTHERLVHTHHCARIIKLAAVVGCRKEGNELPLGEKLVPVFYNLMRTTNEIEIVFLQEPRYNVWAERETDSAVVLAPSGYILVGIRP